MSVLDFFGECPRERKIGGAGKKRTQGRETNFPGQHELVGQGRVTQQSWFQDFQRTTAPFSAEKEAFTGN